MNELIKVWTNKKTIQTNKKYKWTKIQTNKSTNEKNTNEQNYKKIIYKWTKVQTD